MEQLSETASSSRGLLLQRFRDLREYLCLLGEHINLIHNSMERIEKNISEMQNQQASTVEQSQKDLQQIKEIMAAKSEVEALLQELNEAVKGAFPSILSPIPEQLSGREEEHADTTI